LLDDDRDLRALLCAALSVEGFRVLEAGKGREAEVVIKGQTPDLLVIDGLLPDGSGVDFIARLRANDKTTPIFFMSAFFRDAKTLRHLTTDLGVALVLYKPLDAAELARKARDLLERRTEAEREERVTVAPELALDHAFAELRKEFATKLPARVAELATAIDAVRKDPTTADAARSLAHRLRGTAGSYGFAALGDAAGRIEDLFDKAKGATPFPPPFFWPQLQSALDDVNVASGKRSPEIVVESVRMPATRALLVVDADPEFLATARDVSRRVAINVVTAQTSAEALQLSQRMPLHGALLDVHIDGDDGAYALAAALRERPESAGIPIAFASTDRRLETRVGAIEAGGSRFFEKPISAETFAGLLQQFETLSAATAGSVLVVDDDPDVIREYSLVLRGAGMRVEAALSAEAVFERLETSGPDLLILDVNLPHVSGLDVCRAVRMSQRWELLPILVATGRGDVETRVKAFRAGASDVLVKPILADELLARVGVQLERARLVRDRSEKDSLSGLLLRRPFLEAVHRGLSLAARENKPYSVALLDLDHFKRVNDDFGHAAGDSVIAGLGSLLRRKFRLEDLRGRWGGEEFIVAFPGQTGATTASLVTRLLDEFRKLTFQTEKGPLSATFSAGVAEFPVDGSAAATLIKSADDRLYVSKQQGRARVTAGSARQK
jgi:diguanylate cyclase (GGDEF)-like protein